MLRIHRKNKDVHESSFRPTNMTQSKVTFDLNSSSFGKLDFLQF